MPSVLFYSVNPYSFTSPSLNKIPPTISENQCTPEIRRIATIKTMNNASVTVMVRMSHLRARSRLNCFIEVGIMHITSIVVEDGYEASKNPFIKAPLCLTSPTKDFINSQQNKALSKCALITTSFILIAFFM